MGELSIPRSVEDVTPAWLTSALRSEPALADVTVTDVAVEPIGVGVGVMALLYRLTPTYEGAPGPAPLVAKLASPHEQTRQIAAGYRFYEREVATYRDLTGRLPALNPPHAYAAAHDPETGDFVVVMDDLGGLRCCSQVDGCTVEDARTIVRALAAHHAQWWMSDELVALPYLQRVADPPYPQFQAQSTKEAWRTCRHVFAGSVPADLHPVAERWGDIGPALMESTADDAWTFIHGDVRLDNVFFLDDAAATVSLVDWQIGFRGPGPQDLGYFVSQSLATETRRRVEDDLLHEYHAALAANGVDLSWDDLVAQYDRSVLFSFAYPLSAAASCDLVNDRAVALVAAMFDRTAQAIVDRDALRLLPG